VAEKVSLSWLIPIPLNRWPQPMVVIRFPSASEFCPTVLKQHHRKPRANRATSSIFNIKKLSLNTRTRIFSAQCSMLQMLRGTGCIWHYYKSQHGKNMQCVFWKRKLVASILTNPSGLEALASVPLQTCLCHVFCRHLIPVRTLSTMCFPFLTRNPHMGK